MLCWQQASLLNKTLKIAKMMLKCGVKNSLILKICQIEQSNLKIRTMRYTEWLRNRYCSTNKCLVYKPYWRSNVKKSLFCTLYGVLKLVIFHSYMSCKCRMLIQNTELLTPVTQNWHNFFRSYEEMAENGRKQQKSMSLSLTSETAVEYTIWPANDTYIITVCWVMKNREKQMISTS